PQVAVGGAAPHGAATRDETRDRPETATTPAVLDKGVSDDPESTSALPRPVNELSKPATVQVPTLPPIETATFWPAAKPRLAQGRLSSRMIRSDSTSKLPIVWPPAVGPLVTASQSVTEIVPVR